MKLCAGSLQTMPYVSVLSAPMCRDRTELINNLIVFASKMINLKLFRIDEQCADLLLDPELDRCCALRKLCEEIGYKGLIEVWRMQSTEVVNEWKLVQRNYYDRENAFIGRRLKRNFDEVISDDSIRLF
ncbi:unnamed protein product [Anisakis simplex]|uniref:Nudix hydrolase domain-containing protein n=1 Tax=Anisakis simplex TaxID=6269 RepID=A0A0M3JE98_ANISI|nr:unnamed protein product [Anisakis simplex]